MSMTYVIKTAGQCFSGTASSSTLAYTSAYVTSYSSSNYSRLGSSGSSYWFAMRFPVDKDAYVLERLDNAIAAGYEITSISMTITYASLSSSSTSWTMRYGILSSTDSSTGTTLAAAGSTTSGPTSGTSFTIDLTSLGYTKIGYGFGSSSGFNYFRGIKMATITYTTNEPARTTSGTASTTSNQTFNPQLKKCYSSSSTSASSTMAYTSLYTTGARMGGSSSDRYATTFRIVDREALHYARHAQEAGASITWKITMDLSTTPSGAFTSYIGWTNVSENGALSNAGSVASTTDSISFPKSSSVEFDFSDLTMTGSRCISIGSGNKSYYGSTQFSDLTDTTFTVAYPHEKRTITFNANGGSGAPSAQSFYTCHGTEGWWISSTVPTRSGCTFLGWDTSSSATTAVYQPGDECLTTGTSTVLYAVWESESGVSVYYFNGTGLVQAAVYYFNGTSLVPASFGYFNGSGIVT